MDASVATPEALPATFADRKAAAARRRRLVLGRGATDAQHALLDRLLPLAEVEVEHHRHVENISDRRRLLTGEERASTSRRLQKRLELWPFGGNTTVTIRSGSVVLIGEATCSLTENFNRLLGIRIGFGRAMKQLREQAESPVGLAFAEKAE